MSKALSRMRSGASFLFDSLARSPLARSLARPLLWQFDHNEPGPAICGWKVGESSLGSRPS